MSQLDFSRRTPSEPETTPEFPGAPVGRAAADPFVLGRPRPAPPEAPSRRRAPLLVTGAVLAAALAVVGVASWQAVGPESAPVSAPEIRRVGVVHPVGASAPAAGEGRAPWVETYSEEGTGTLTLPQHRWTTGPTGGPRLLVQVAVADRTGDVRYDPDLFTAMDAQGRAYRSQPLTADALGSGVLSPGQVVQGWVAFDLARGPVTITLHTWRGTDVAGLRLPG